MTYEDFYRLEAKIDAIMAHLGIKAPLRRSVGGIDAAMDQKVKELEKRQQQRGNRKK